MFLVEDSIVRSTTLRVIIDMIRDYGFAKEVHVRVACPPIMAPCSYGIDMSRISELIAPKFFDEPLRGALPGNGLESLAKDLGADSLRYLTVDQLTHSLEFPESDLCVGCLTGEYPTDWGNKIYEEAKLAKDDPDSERTYERLARQRLAAANVASRAQANGNGSSPEGGQRSPTKEPEASPVESD